MSLKEPEDTEYFSGFLNPKFLFKSTRTSKMAASALSTIMVVRIVPQKRDWKISRKISSGELSFVR